MQYCSIFFKPKYWWFDIWISFSDWLRSNLVLVFWCNCNLFCLNYTEYMLFEIKVYNCWPRPKYYICNKFRVRNHVVNSHTISIHCSSYGTVQLNNSFFFLKYIREILYIIKLQNTDMFKISRCNLSAAKWSRCFFNSCTQSRANELSKSRK